MMPGAPRLSTSGLYRALISNGGKCSQVCCLYLSPHDPWQLMESHAGHIFIKPNSLSMSSLCARGRCA